MDEGYIKFSCTFIDGNPPEEESLTELNRARRELYDLGLIGMYENGIGFGNISKRVGKGFVISGSATGGIEKLGPEHYALVTDYSLEDNSLECIGRIKASSESLTHAAVYEACPSAKVVIHIHNLKAWNALLDKVPTTAKVPYGTPEMAYEIFRLFKETDIERERILVMAGHQEGIISFGNSCKGALQVLLEKVKPLL
jgi:ribulose-5-phosphate 4-epimerase/fuculose-1-phosphate aldolase